MESKVCQASWQSCILKYVGNIVINILLCYYKNNNFLNIIIHAEFSAHAFVMYIVFALKGKI